MKAKKLKTKINLGPLYPMTADIIKVLDTELNQFSRNADEDQNRAERMDEEALANSMKLEDELKHLHREINTIQADRQNEMMGTTDTFKRQNRLLSIFNKEYIDIKKNLKVARSGDNKKNDKKTKKNVKLAIGNFEKLKTNLTESRANIEELDEMIYTANKDLLEHQKIANLTIGKKDAEQRQGDKTVAATENKEEVAIRKFDRVYYENAKLRETIESMLKDRANFNAAWEKMISSLTKGRKFLIDLFEQSTLAYDQRDEWVGKLKAMVEKGKMDQKLHTQEMRDLQRSLDHCSQLANFLAIKGTWRINRKQEKRDEEKKIRDKLEIEKKLHTHNKILNQVKAFAQEQDYAKIIQNFKNIESQNMSIFKYAMETCAEKEKLRREILDIRTLIIDRRDWNETKLKRRKEKNLQREEELEMQKRRNDERREKVKIQDEELAMVDKFIEEIYKIMKCDESLLESLLGDKTPTLRNYYLTMAAIHEKVNENIQLVYYQERHLDVRSVLKRSPKARRSFNIVPEGPVYLIPNPLNRLVKADPCVICVEARRELRVDEGLEYPLTEEEAREVIDKMVNDEAYEEEDTRHPIVECRNPKSRLILAKRYI